MSKDLIIGVHSIAEALMNPKRHEKKIYGTEDSVKDLKKSYKHLLDFGGSVKIELFTNNHKFQQHSERIYAEYGHKFQRIPGNILLEASHVPFVQIGSLFDRLKDSSGMRLLCLDQVTDPQNAAAILRTASFYGVDSIIMPGKSSTGFSPGFFRVSSGAAEHVNIFVVSNLSRFVSRFNELGGHSIGFSEHSEEKLLDDKLEKDQNILLVLGNEEKGISNAVSRQVSSFTSLKTQGKIHSLNVSVAAAVAMEKFFKAK
tara:strand:- start:346 stop:1119 length:774 start_codon:yes stop_codon:yes gene_type:complete